MKDFVLQKTSPFAAATSSRPCARIVPDENQRLAPTEPEVPALGSPECEKKETEVSAE